MQLDLNKYSLYANHNTFVRPDGVPFWHFLLEKDIEYKKSHFPFLTTSEAPKIRAVFNWDEFIKLQSRGEALSYLYAGLGRSLNYVGPVLDQELQHGFNDHTDRHTLWVSQTAVELLARAGKSYDGVGHYDVTTELLLTLVGMTHDIGNFLSRKDHSQLSVWLLTRLFSGIQYDSPEWQAVVYAILFHEEPVLLENKLALSAGTPLQWALVAADKMHVGRERLGTRSFDSGIKNHALESDVHILVNALLVRSSWSLGVGEFVWHLDFSVDQLEEKFSAFSKGNSRLWLPRKFQDKLLGEGVRYRDTFTQLFSDLYKDRMEMAAESVFLLFPYVQKFRVELVDNDTRAKVGSGRRLVWLQSRKHGVE
ncbi:hypothetical protein KA082_01260 [Candidatus Woesebacteria bacterium]|nr:hypothetical protein [Candidatus Woesebacteria bacterium]